MKQFRWEYEEASAWDKMKQSDNNAIIQGVEQNLTNGVRCMICKSYRTFPDPNFRQNCPNQNILLHYSSNVPFPLIQYMEAQTERNGKEMVKK